MKNILSILGAITFSVSLIAPSAKTCLNRKKMSKDFPVTDLGFLPDLKKDTIINAIKAKNPKGNLKDIQIQINQDSTLLYADHSTDKGPGTYDAGDKLNFNYYSKIRFDKTNNKTYCRLKLHSTEECELKIDITSDEFSPEIDTLPFPIKNDEGFLIIKRNVNLVNKTIAFKFSLNFNRYFEKIENTALIINWHDAEIVKVPIYIH